MSSPDLALNLLLLRGRDEDVRTRARELARQLSDENTKRQVQEAEILADARRLIDGDPEIGGPNLLLVAGEGWHRGIIGIVASKLVDLYGKPALVLAIDGDVAYGSGRGISAFDLLGSLDECRDVFLRYGGHRAAAGVTLETARIPELRRRLGAIANERLSPDDLIPRLRIDAPLGLREISSDVIEGLVKLGPFGASNPKPVFRAAPVELLEAPKRIKDRHLSLIFRQQGRAFRAIAWRAAEREAYLTANRFGLEVAYSLEQGEYRGETTTEMTVADVRVPQEVPA
jgi:single-stranded-DNA-specific exonuclease